MRSRPTLPFAVGAGVLLGHVALLVAAVRRHTGGTYCYPIDDAFIHLAIAKHIAFDGVYGVTKYAFASASSSIVWPILLALVIRITGDHTVIPLVLNMIFGVGLVWVVANLLRRAETAVTWWRVAIETLIVGAIVFMAPLPTLVSTGMEHTLHAIATLLLVAAGADALSGEDSPAARAARPWRLAGLAAFAVMTRYEGIFPIAIIAALALVRRRPWTAACVAIGGIIPLVSFGAYSLAHGGMFFPNSVVLKGRHIAFHSLDDVTAFFGGDLFERLGHESHIAGLVIVTFAMAFVSTRRAGLWSASSLRLIIAGLVTLAHVQMASLGWFFRYEAYLIVLNMTVVGMELLQVRLSPADRKVRALLAVVVMFTLGGPLWTRAVQAASVTPMAGRSVFNQQVQSARFLAKYFGDEPVAVNDIGAVSYFGNEPVVDLLGLASMPVARAKKFQLDVPLRKEDLSRFTQDTHVAIIYDEWLGGSVPPSWIRLGRWRIEDNQSCAFPDVSIYATSPDAIPRVMAALRDFSASLPKGVHEEGRYMEPAPSTDGVYRGTVGDVLDVLLDGAPDHSMLAVVQADGAMYPGVLGEVGVRGRTLEQITESVEKRIDVARADGYKIPPVSAVHVRLIVPFRTRVYSVGQLERGCEFSTDAPVTAETILGWAGGPTDGRSADGAYVLREDESGLHRLPLTSPVVVGRADPAYGPVLVSRDIVVLP